MSNDKHHEDCSLHNAPKQSARAREWFMARRKMDAYISFDDMEEYAQFVARQQTAAKEAEILKLQEQVFRPLGDNHHNAALCPYCNPQRKAAERERDNLRESRDQLLCHVSGLVYAIEYTPSAGQLRQCVAYKTAKTVLESQKAVLAEALVRVRNAALKAGKDGQ